MTEGKYKAVELGNGNIIFYPIEDDLFIKIPTKEEMIKAAKAIGLPDEFTDLISDDPDDEAIRRMRLIQIFDKNSGEWIKPFKDLSKCTNS